ncbi:FkbM family methyltransferase [Coleofasciculus sp. FACHB-64]|uniref:FkbM family methyltransferase n=1 Tax=Cyanophyceae TaxID=3028117 RepID=UPI00168628AA|nr:MULTISPECIES: FkbM family methyltransferase [unclassified Coleofasciculus]MBD1838943.1 FkbM family methyltransferase [Coleofasciculus sp. FACHB-501]MBD2048501.1 FkbM family methyltransferase [Coleofasciculus sp. FACHB-64]
MSFFLSSLKSSGHLEQVHMTVGIVGSRKIVREDDYASQGWHIFAPNLTIYGFDADAESCDAMNSEIEARQVSWNEKHIPQVLWNSVGEATLYVTNFTGSSSLYPPNESYLKRFAGYLEWHQLVTTVEVDTITLDAFCESEQIEEMDFLQVDVQGADLQVLEGASKIIERSILGILTEVEFISLYRNQPLFSDIDTYLRNKDFTLFDLAISTGRGVRTDSPIVSETHPGSLIWADAFYFRDLIREDLNTHLKTPERILKLACIADIMNFADYALELLEYLTLNYGEDGKYNFADNIIESLAQVPELVAQGLDSLPIVARISKYTSGKHP